MRASYHLEGKSFDFFFALLIITITAYPKQSYNVVCTRRQREECVLLLRFWGCCCLWEALREEDGAPSRLLRLLKDVLWTTDLQSLILNERQQDLFHQSQHTEYKMVKKTRMLLTLLNPKNINQKHEFNLKKNKKQSGPCECRYTCEFKWSQAYHFFDLSLGGGLRGIKNSALIGCMSHRATPKDREWQCREKCRWHDFFMKYSCT